MRRALIGSLLIAIAAVIGLGVFWLFERGGQGSEDADATLTRLSKQSGDLTYYARYQGADQNDANSLSSIALYNKPGVGFRFDLPTPLLSAKEDANLDNDVLRSGDILIVNLTLPERYISCRTLRQTCRTADGLERLTIVSFLTLFRFDPPLFEQPHSVRRTADISALGETAKCFVISRRSVSKNEQATADASSSISDKGLPKTICYTNDGVPLGGLVSDSPPNTNWIKAVELKREVDDAAFKPPFPMVSSVYDSTPTASPTAPKASP
jgi:hypothetical protein